MMRLAYVCADGGVPVFGTKGCSVHVQEFVRACRQRGLDVELFAARVGGVAPPDLADMRVHRLRTLGTPADWPISDDVLAREEAALARNRHVHVQLAARGPFDLIYERHALWSCGAMEHARAVGVPAVLEINAPLLEEQSRHRALRQRDVAETVMRRAFVAADVVLPVSDLLGDWLVTQGVPRSRVHVVPNAVDPARFSETAAAAIDSSPDMMTVGFLGTLKPWHGLDVLVDALGTLRRRSVACRLLVVGDGPGRAALERRLDAVGCADAVVWAGAVSPADVPSWLAAMDVAVAPYAAADGCYFSPLKAFEYMAAGLPVVASAVGQLPSLIRDGRTGVLVPPGCPEALADAIAALRADPDLRRRLGSAARAHVLTHHTWCGTVERVCSLAQMVQRDRGPSPRIDGVSLREAGSHVAAPTY